MATHTYGGGIDQTAVIGHAPEHRDWRPEHGCVKPEVASTARIEAFVTVDAGVKVPTSVGDGTWLMKRVHIGHDAQIGHDCELAPGVVVGGHVVIGNGVRVGIGAMFRPGVKVGDGARIGCGANVVSDVPAGEVWVGNPAHRLLSHSDRRSQSVEGDLESLTGASIASVSEWGHAG